MKSFFTFHEAFRSLTPRSKAAKVPRGFKPGPEMKNHGIH
jgi:hypothetical protein